MQVKEDRQFITWSHNLWGGTCCWWPQLCCWHTCRTTQVASAVETRNYLGLHEEVKKRVWSTSNADIIIFRACMLNIHRTVLVDTPQLNAKSDRWCASHRGNLQQTCETTRWKLKVVEMFRELSITVDENVYWSEDKAPNTDRLPVSMDTRYSPK